MCLVFAQDLVVNDHLKTIHQDNHKEEIECLKKCKIELKNESMASDMSTVDTEEVTLTDFVSTVRRKCLHCQTSWPTHRTRLSSRTN